MLKDQTYLPGEGPYQRPMTQHNNSFSQNLNNRAILSTPNSSSQRNKGFHRSIAVPSENRNLKKQLMNLKKQRFMSPAVTKGKHLELKNLPPLQF